MSCKSDAPGIKWCKEAGDPMVAVLDFMSEEQCADHVQELLPAMKNVNATNYRGDYATSLDTALIMAVKHGRAKVFDVLLEESRVDINHQDVMGMTAIMWAVRCKRQNKIPTTNLKGEACYAGEHIYRRLIEVGADLLLPTRSGRTPLHEVVSSKEVYDMTICTELLYATWTAEEPLYLNGKTRPRKELLLNAENRAGETALHVAAREGLDDMCQLLLGLGANPRSTSAWGIGAMPIHLAALGGHHHLFESLMLDAKMYEISGVGPDLWQPLHWAVASGLDPNPAVEPLLAIVSQTCNISLADAANAKTASGVTAIEIAARLGHNRVVTILMLNDALVGNESGRALQAKLGFSMGGQTPSQVVIDHIEKTSMRMSLRKSTSSLGRH